MNIILCHDPSFHPTARTVFEFDEMWHYCRITDKGAVKLKNEGKKFLNCQHSFFEETVSNTKCSIVLCDFSDTVMYL